MGRAAHHRVDPRRLPVPLPRGAARGPRAHDGPEHLAIQAAAHPRQCADRRTVPCLVKQPEHGDCGGERGPREREREARAPHCHAGAEATGKR